MEQYIRKNSEGVAVLDYDELDIAARINFLEDAKRTADSIELDLDDPDFSNAEKAEALNDVAKLQSDSVFAYLDAQIDPETKQMFIEKIISELASRYGVNL